MMEERMGVNIFKLWRKSGGLYMRKITIGLNSAVLWIIKCTPDFLIGDLGYNF